MIAWAHTPLSGKRKIGWMKEEKVSLGEFYIQRHRINWSTFKSHSSNWHSWRIITLWNVITLRNFSNTFNVNRQSKSYQYNAHNFYTRLLSFKSRRTPTTAFISHAHVFITPTRLYNTHMSFSHPHDFSTSTSLVYTLKLLCSHLLCQELMFAASVSIANIRC